ncbi:MAG TPA: HIT family protein [Bryobacteraceae bacterium]|jgi:histidine triad (HIT) family protein|nr:HIT family protein [Bryobacteraceae bacterium]
MSQSGCVFCRIAAGEVQAAVVYEDDDIIVFLDSSPLFEGHSLVCPKAHVETMLDLEESMMQPLFGVAKRVAKALETGLGAAGSLVCVNNRVSQSVPHLHVHVIPRRPKDGLKGFFWPRRPYNSRGEMEAVAGKVRDALASES